MPRQTLMANRPQTFTVFPKLPAEIRRLIFEAMCKPRTIEVLYEGYEVIDARGFYTYAPSPPALDICRESRNTVISRYPLCFGSVFFPATVRFNFELDTLFLDEHFREDLPHLVSTFKDAEFNGLRYLALSDYYLVPYTDSDLRLDENLQRTLEALKSLKELLLVFDVERMNSVPFHALHSRIWRSCFRTEEAAKLGMGLTAWCMAGSNVKTGRNIYLDSDDSDNTDSSEVEQDFLEHLSGNDTESVN
ncbi:uncharacterized protein LY89DRAFT_664468 [Mollisia scopiformis]|uniref:2EXR domain-containing protein n=1 Tax=Mollisia scopiformis TaxID=149040 RepID=A0A194XR92_MOLSC|nr:uncharacterized protein LY89DRAFT_664468 [Mollisia scopiformis]KUJ22671.1 hypothetical protein LY89DRAFT_664468 [Mollisia scopiformis]